MGIVDCYLSVRDLYVEISATKGLCFPCRQFFRSDRTLHDMVGEQFAKLLGVGGRIDRSWRCALECGIGRREHSNWAILFQWGRLAGAMHHWTKHVEAGT